MEVPEEDDGLREWRLEQMDADEFVEVNTDFDATGNGVDWIARTDEHILLSDRYGWERIVRREELDAPQCRLRYLWPSLDWDVDAGGRERCLNDRGVDEYVRARGGLLACV